MSQPENLLEFKPRDGVATELVIQPWSPDKCKHEKMELDDDLRRVECKSCHEVLDPLQVLIEIAHKQRRFESEAENAALRLRRFEAIEHALRNRQNLDMRTEFERGLTAFDLQAHHLNKGCPKERMWFDRKMVRCYCGSSFNADFYPARALEIKQAHDKLRAALAVAGDKNEKGGEA